MPLAQLALAVLVAHPPLSQEPTVRRVLDAGALLVALDEGLAPRPWLAPFAAEKEGSTWPVSQPAPLQLEALAGLLAAALGDPAQPGSVRVEARGGSSLEVEGSEAAVAAASHLLARLGERLVPDLVLVVERVPWEPGAPPPLAPGIWSEQEIDAALPADVRRATRLALRPGHTARVDALERRAIVTHHDVQVAQSAFAYQPELAIAEAGLRIAARWWPTSGGDRLALRLEASDPVGEPVALADQLAGRIALNDALHVAQSDLPRQRLSMLSRGWTYCGPLPEGRALVLFADWRIALPTGDEASGAEVWVLRREGRGPAAAERLPLPGGRTLDLVAADALGDAQFVLAHGERRDLGEGGAWALRAGSSAGDGPAVELLVARPGAALERLPGRPRDWRPVGPWLAAVQPAGTALPELPSTEASATAGGATIDLLAASGGPLVARLGVPLPAGARWSAAIASVTPLVTADSVEVAGQVGVRAQDVVFERRGVAASAALWASPDGAWQARFGVEAQLVSGGLVELPLDGVFGGAIESAPSAGLSSTRALSGAADEAKSALLGGARGPSARVGFRPMAAKDGTQSPN